MTAAIHLITQVSVILETICKSRSLLVEGLSPILLKFLTPKITSKLLNDSAFTETLKELFENLICSYNDERLHLQSEINFYSVSSKYNKIVKKLRSQLEGVEQTVNTRLINKVTNLYRGLLDVLTVHFGRLPSETQTIQTCLKWLNYAALDRLEEYYKVQSCYLLSLLTQQNKLINEMPELPGWLKERPGYLLGGWFFRHAKRLISQGLTKEDLGAFYAICNVKRAGLAISKKKIAKAIEKHRNNMVGGEYKPKPVPQLAPYLKCKEGPRNCRQFEIDDIKYMIQQRLIMLIEKAYKGKHMNVKWRSPSISACYEFSALSGGSHMHFERDELIRHYEFVGYISYKTRVTPIYAPYHPDDLFDDLKEYARNYSNSHIKAKVHTVLEPFKARIITAGEGKIYQYGRLLQKPIHRIMRNFHSMFALTGKPCSREFIEDVYRDAVISEECLEVGYMDPNINKDLRSGFCAGDYSAATDGMDPSVSTTFNENIYRVTDFNDLDLKVMNLCMGGHQLEYAGQDDVIQTWGQLMGSPLSFPILCFANAAVNWVAADVYYDRNLSFREWVTKFRPLFNGDDTSFLTNSVHYETWKSVAACVGLNPSLGKSYVSPNFVMINSEIYWMVKDPITGQVKEAEDVGVLNPGLVKGQAKVLDDTRCDYRVTEAPYGTLLPLVDQLNKAQDKFPPEKVQLIQDIFVSHTLGRLKSINRSWCLPKWLGGLGLSFGDASYSQRKLAAMALMSLDNESEFKIGQLSSFEKEVPECVETEQRMIREISDNLGVEYVRTFDKPAEPLEQYSLSKYIIGGGHVSMGRDRYNTLLKVALKAAWVSPISDEAILEYKNKKSYLVPDGFLRQV